MENTEKYTLTTDHTPEQPEEGQFNLAPSESAFFAQMEKNLKKYAADLDASNPLGTLYENIRCLNRLFTTFGHPWITNCAEIQKACTWYLANAQPAKREASNLIETLNGFTASACYLAEWNGLVNRMQEFLSIQEKELKRLFKYEKEMEKKQEERIARMLEDGVTYNLTLGKGEIYGVTFPQIEELYRVMERFIEREKTPFECRIEGYDEYFVSISKDINLCADREEFHVSYSLNTNESDLECMSAGQMQRVANAISGFLKMYGENGERKVCWDIADYPQEEQPDVVFEIKEDDRQPVFRTVPWISKRINKKEEEETEIAYFIDVNEIHSPELSFGEFVSIYRKLGDFLKEPVKM